MAEEVTFNQRPKKETREKWVTKKREFGAEQPAGAKRLKQEGTWAIWAQKETNER